MTLGLLGGATPERYLCSRASCSKQAQHAIRWQNPRIHTGDRKKTWLACDEHLQYLRDFLESRSFPLQVISILELDRAAEGRHAE